MFRHTMLRHFALTATFASVLGLTGLSVLSAAAAIPSQNGETDPPEPDGENVASVNSITHYDILLTENDVWSIHAMAGTTTVAEILTWELGDGTRTEVFIPQTGEILKLNVSQNSAYGAVFEDGTRIAHWILNEQDEYDAYGFEPLSATSDAWKMILLLSDDEQLHSNVELVAALPLLAPAVYLIWCISQCQCCDYHHQNPDPGTPEPSCCGNCFAPRCLDFD